MAELLSQYMGPRVFDYDELQMIIRDAILYSIWHSSTFVGFREMVDFKLVEEADKRGYTITDILFGENFVNDTTDITVILNRNKRIEFHIAHEFYINQLGANL